ncbi:MAG: Hsp20/alpha crystallin family protein [Eubacterium sp.]|nr:Hsp20/alpha crystallin family protein [Eubacterium sp.]
MLLPELFGDTFDDFWDDAWNNRWLQTNTAARRMNADIRETADSYQLELELPGFAKDEVHAELKDGYLTVTAAKNTSNDQKDKAGRYVRRERYTGSLSRSFYVGEGLEPEDIKARFENGILSLELPKEAPKKVESKKTISIDG